MHYGESLCELQGKKGKYSRLGENSFLKSLIKQIIYVLAVVQKI